MFLLFGFLGASQLRTSHSKASKARDLQGAGLSHKMYISNWRAKRNARVQRVNADHRWYNCQYRTAAHLSHAHRHADRR